MSETQRFTEADILAIVEKKQGQITLPELSHELGLNGLVPTYLSTIYWQLVIAQKIKPTSPHKS